MEPSITRQNDNVLVQYPISFVMNALPNCCSYSAATVWSRFRQFTCGPYDPKRQLALLLNSFAGEPCCGCFLFLGLLINLCFVPWNCVVQKLLSLIGVMCQNAWESTMWWALWSSMRFWAPSMHTLISNPGGCRQCCVRYSAKCLAVLSNLIRTHDTWTLYVHFIIISLQHFLVILLDHYQVKDATT